MNYTEQATALIENLGNFNKVEFEEWYLKNNTIITYNDFLGFLMAKKRIGSIKLISELLNVSLTGWGLVLNDDILDLVKKDDVELLKKFYVVGHSNIGDNAVMYYLNKDRIKVNEDKNKRLQEITDYLLNNFNKLKELCEK